MDRNQKNLQELLKFAIKQQSGDNAGANHEIDEDKKAFLENVLSSMSGDVVEVFLTAIRVLDHEQSSVEEKCDALDLIRDHIDNLDFANSFVKVEGSEILIKCINDDYTDIRVNAINIVAEMSQNNPFCQQYFLDSGIIKLLISYLSHSDDKVVASSLYALSALISNFEPALAELQKAGGFQNILKCLNSKCSRVFIKACFLISSISSEFTLVRDEFAQMNAFELLANNLESITDFDTKSDILLIAMAELIKSKKCNPDTNLRKNITDILKSIVDKNKNLPQCEEIVSNSKFILEQL